MDDPFDITVRPFGHGCRQFLGEMCRHGVVEHGGAMSQFLRLAHSRFDDAWVRMTYRNAQVHAQKVGIFSPLHIPEVLHLALFKDQRLTKWHKFFQRRRVVGVAAGGGIIGGPVGVQHLSAFQSGVFRIERGCAAQARPSISTLTPSRALRSRRYASASVLPVRWPCAPEVTTPTTRPFWWTEWA